MKKPMKMFTPALNARLLAFGERLKLARLRRNLTTETIAARGNISRMTLYRIESGDPSVAFGHYVRVLTALGLLDDLDAVALVDVLGRKLQDLGLDVRVRKPARRRNPAHSAKQAIAQRENAEKRAIAERTAAEKLPRWP